MYRFREDEQDYAIIPDVESPELNRYGKPVQLVEEGDNLADKSLNINSDPSIGENPNRYKQHGFYFNADNCISCHACESACSEKNDLPAHIAFRSVGYIEGGTYPAYQRLNISMACNHCDDPVCLKGCPTRAYTKFAEYGAVLQDPEICFGCGYCTWVCPYNAPQLDTKAGHVSKCNMCVDRLEVGLKPACASACLAGALDFGVIETKPENRDQLEVQMPGFPDPEITHPNIRFQQNKTLPREMTRPDSMPLRYERDEQGQGAYKSKVRKIKKDRQWGLNKLRSREDPLVLFTLITQTVIGAFIVLFLGNELLGVESFSINQHPVAILLFLFALFALQTIALVLSTMHLGKPHRFYRAFNNLRYSPVSREVAGIAIFYNMLGAYTLAVVLPSVFSALPKDLMVSLQGFFGWAAVIAGPVALYFMCKIYHIKARPFWNHWQVFTSFYGSMLSLGPLLAGLVFAAVLVSQDASYNELMLLLSVPVLAGLVLEVVGLVFHARDLEKHGGEGAASHYEQLTSFGKTYLSRNISLAVSIVAVSVLALSGVDGWGGYVFWLLTAVMLLATSLVGRALLYVLVIPTTMPGAFFWRNQGFQEHARETGLVKMQQVGVVADIH